MDKLELFNRVVNFARPAGGEKTVAKSLDDSYADVGVDSLDIIMICIYFSEIYGVDEETAKTLQPQNPRECVELFEKHATKHPATIEEALANIAF